MHCISCIVLYIFLAFVIHIQVYYQASLLHSASCELREEVSTLKAGMANLTALMESLVAAQNQPSSVQPQQERVTTEAPTVPVSYTPAVVKNRMPQGYP